MPARAIPLTPPVVMASGAKPSSLSGQSLDRRVASLLAMTLAGWSNGLHSSPETRGSGAERFVKLCSHPLA